MKPSKVGDRTKNFVLDCSGMSAHKKVCNQVWAERHMITLNDNQIGGKRLKGLDLKQSEYGNAYGFIWRFPKMVVPPNHPF